MPVPVRVVCVCVWTVMCVCVCVCLDCNVYVAGIKPDANSDNPQLTFFGAPLALAQLSYSKSTKPLFPIHNYVIQSLLNRTPRCVVIIGVVQPQHAYFSLLFKP